MLRDDFLKLQDSLAKRLYDLHFFIGDPVVKMGFPEWELAGSIQRESWRKLARECMRQMDWNAREAFDSCCNRGPLDQDLTIAPEDWCPKPE